MDEVEAVFPLIAFTTDTVARLTGLSIRQLHYWDRKGFFSPSFADPHRRRPHSRVYSFDDVVGLRTVARLRREGVSFPQLWEVHRFFRSSDNKDWAGRKFWVIGDRVFFTHADAVIAARPIGQLVDATVLDLGPIVSDTREAVQGLRQRTADQIGKITKDRLIMNGAPILDGTRIPTMTVDWFHRHGYDEAEILREFPRLKPDDIRAAVDYELAHRRDSVAAVEEVG